MLAPWLCRAVRTCARLAAAPWSPRAPQHEGKRRGWLGWEHGRTGESVPAFLLRENASSPMNVQQQNSTSKPA